MFDASRALLRAGLRANAPKAPETDEWAEILRRTYPELDENMTHAVLERRKRRQPRPVGR